MVRTNLVCQSQKKRARKGGLFTQIIPSVENSLRTHGHRVYFREPPRIELQRLERVNDLQVSRPRLSLFRFWRQHVRTVYYRTWVSFSSEPKAEMMKLHLMRVIWSSSST
jgi:hypothetical protein